VIVSVGFDITDKLLILIRFLQSSNTEEKIGELYDSTSAYTSRTPITTGRKILYNILIEFLVQ
jgi:hypothetical protein